MFLYLATAPLYAFPRLNSDGENTRPSSPPLFKISHLKNSTTLL